MNEDERVKNSVFLVMTEEGYDSENGFRVLEKIIQKFWDLVDLEFVQKRDNNPFQFSEVLKQDYKSITVNLL